MIKVLIVVAGYLIGGIGTFILLTWRKNRFDDTVFGAIVWPPIMLWFVGVGLIAITWRCLCIVFDTPGKWLHKLYDVVNKWRDERERMKKFPLPKPPPPVLIREGGDYRHAPSDKLIPEPKKNRLLLFMSRSPIDLMNRKH